MEAAAALRPAPNFFSVPDSASRCRLILSHRSQFGAQLPKHRSSISLLNNGWQCRSAVSKRNLKVQASSGDFGEVSPTPIAPLQMESPVGQFLSQILANHPHLLAAAIDQQLHQLQSDRDAMEATGDASAPSTDLVLYRRIAEVKANERRRTLEEILYALVVQKFMDAGVSLVPTIISQPSGKPGKVEHWSSEEEKLRMLHSPEAYEMIKNHLSLILGKKLESPDAVAPISKLRVGQVYAASIMYGYFLKRVDQRFQLEKTIKTLPWGSDGEVDPGSLIQQAVFGESQPAADISAAPSASFGVSGFADRIKPCRLRSYVMSFDTETLQRCATIRSKEAFSIIEKHTEALFGRPEIVITPEGTIDSSKDEVIKISFAGLKRLILEAVTFGSFLWDVESYVDSRYHFVMG